MRLVSVLIFATCLGAQPAWADVNCAAVRQIARVYSSLTFMRMSPFGETLPANFKVLSSDLSAISAPAMRQSLADHPSGQEIDALVALVASAKLKLPTDDNLTRFATSLQSNAWATTLKDAAIALNNMACGATIRGLPGDIQGRSMEQEPAPARAPSETRIENPVQVAIFAILGILAGSWAIRNIALWLRNRAILKKRRSKRFATHLPSQLGIGETVIEAEILDLSCNGAKLKYWHAETIPDSAQLTVLINDKTCTCKSVWSNPNYVGLVFATILPIPLVRELAQANKFDGLGKPIKNLKRRHDIKKKKATSAKNRAASKITK